MANCPNCGSDHIQLTTYTNVNWGRAVVGYVLFGVVGGAVGGVTGDDRKAIVCLDCGTSWNPALLYKIIKEVEDLTAIELDLTLETDRFFLEDYMREIPLYFQALTEKEKQAEDLIKKTEMDEFATLLGCGCMIGGIITLIAIGAILIGSILSGIFGIIIGVPLIGFFILYMNSKFYQEKLEQAKIQAKRIKKNAREEFNKAIQYFIKFHHLD